MTKKKLGWIVVLCAACACCVAIVTAQTRPRARQLGIAPGIYPPGRLNAITDVVGVRVGHTTVIEGDDVRTGVTAILPHGGNLFQEKVAGAVFVGNAFGKLAGSTQVTELGTIETPIVLTNTLSVGVAMDAVVRYTLGRPGNEQVRSVNALVGETNDGSLNDIRGFHITQQHVVDAIVNASVGPVAEGSVGAGTGTMAFGWKGGIGTSSRTLPSGYVVGVLAQANFGGNLTIAGAPIFRVLQPRRTIAGVRNSDPNGASGDGSRMLIVATDAPLDARDLGRLARVRVGVLSAHKKGSPAAEMLIPATLPIGPMTLQVLFYRVTKPLWPRQLLRISGYATGWIVSSLSPTPSGRRNFMKNDPGSSVFSMTCERFSTLSRSAGGARNFMKTGSAYYRVVVAARSNGQWRG